MKREDFIFTIGYQGDTALVDGNAKRQFGRLSTRELAEKGFLKTALCSALYSKDQADIDAVLQIYRERSGNQSVTLERLQRILGVFSVSEQITKAKVL
jgi:hypothetical protein